MAEANPNVESETCEAFEKAATHLQSLVSKLEQETLLKLYGLYKQATAGACDIPQPGWFQMQAKKKWEAWHELGDMDRDTAMKLYVETVEAADPEWSSSSSLSDQKTGWVAVSSMAVTDAVLDEADKSVFDWVKEGDVDKVRQWAGQEQGADAVDAEGMGLVHWAADRGNLKMMRLLIEELHANLELADRDGQTALHYACACGHTDVVKLLLENGANPDASDGEGLLPLDIASERKIEELLTVHNLQ